jgi:hypothetical protein
VSQSLDNPPVCLSVSLSVAVCSSNPSCLFSPLSFFLLRSGGSSVATHLTSPASYPYYSAAIIESNPFSLPFHTPDEAAFLAGKVAETLGCASTDLNCMRSKSWQEVNNASLAAAGNFNLSDIFSIFYPWTPTADGVCLSVLSVVCCPLCCVVLWLLLVLVVLSSFF